ncbi:MAG: S24 family peptidase [Streptococcus orisratti]|uniref:S24 family peptidase n=1 Tax=Streptococcus orisratti TaxID=114652 RepID=UPI002A90B83C|nr:S24 family peptidase [Streptococcus orisratti]MDY5636494.1 S24 family peptidase [Streptococcus orisratti]
MPTLAENIKLYRKQAGFTQKELASKLGIAPTAVSAWELGRNKPLMDNVESMALLFNIKKSVLLGEDLHILSTLTEAPKTVSDDVLRLDRDLHSNNHKSWIRYGNKLLDEQNTVNEPQAIYFTYNYYDQPASAGTGQYLNDVKVETIELPIEVDADFVVPIYGDSMEPEYHSGDYVFVKLSVDLSDGDIGVFACNGEAYIKQLRITDKGAYLHSLNPDYDNIPITADTDFRTIGEVVDVYREK